MLDSVIAARAGFGMSLGFHIIFAALGIVMPFFLLISQWLWIRRKNPVYLALNKKWTTAFAISYAIGAVSGTALTFELGLLWPRFMDFAGHMIGVPFSIEAFFFFLEAIFLGIYLFGRDVLSPWVHWFTAVPIALGAVASLVAVVMVNAWMNTPVGYTLDEAGNVIDVDVLRAMFAPAWFAEVSHMTIAAFEAVAFAFAAVYAFGMLRGRRDEYHKKGFLMSMAVATLFAPIMIVSGDATAKFVAKYEPAKLAAIEPQFHTEEGAPLTIGGWPDVENQELRYAIEIPKFLSFLAFDDPNATVQGLDAFPEDQRPDPLKSWWAFDLMVAIGFYLALLVGWFWIAFWRSRGTPTGRGLLRATVLSGFLGFVAIECGWLVTEFGRQPWVIQGVMLTNNGSSPALGVVGGFYGFTLLYVLLAITLIWLLKRIATGVPPELRDQVERSSGEEVAHVS
jgi:cytochrome bd ubiquinol oxidase subunit I